MPTLLMDTMGLADETVCAGLSVTQPVLAVDGITAGGDPLPNLPIEDRLHLADEKVGVELRLPQQLLTTDCPL